MKKSFNVIVGNVAFCFDEDAVLLIENFLDRAGAYYGNDTSKLEDLERTLADELRACVGEGGIVSLETIKAVIEKYDIEEDRAVDCAEDAAPHSSVDSGNDEKTSNNNNNDAENEPWRAAMLLGNKLFRDPHDVLLGGVIAGVAKYIDVSVALLRLLVIVGALLLGNIAGGILVFIYLILWCTIPKAHNVIELTRMRKLNPATSLEQAWKTNYEISMTEMTYPKNRGCLGAGLRILFFVVLALFSLPILFLLALSLFFLVVLVVALFKLFGTVVFMNVHFVLLFLIPLFALVHWILKKCGVLHPLNAWLKASIVIGWILLAIYSVYKLHTEVEKRGGWEAVQNYIIDKKYLDEGYWENLLEYRFSEKFMEHNEFYYSLWDSKHTSLPFIVDAKRSMGLDKITIRFIEQDEWDRSFVSEKYDIFTTDFELYLDDDFDTAEIYCFWDSVSNEIIMDMDRIEEGYSSSINSVNPSIRYLMPSDSVSYGNAMEKGFVPMKFRILKGGATLLYMHGNDSIEGIQIQPVETRASNFINIKM